MLADYHVHSGFSDDSSYPLRQVALDAERLNLDEVCFTEHVDYGVKPEWNQPDTARFEDGRPVTNCPYIPYLDELGRTQEEIHRAYYEELLGVVECFRDYSVLGHLDLIRRYDPFARETGPYPFGRVRDLVAEIPRRVIEDGKGIEVNTSGIRYGLGDFQPAREVLELYRDLGGTVVTVGSDSHRPEHLGSYLRRAYRELEELGFAGVWTFSRGAGTLVRF